MEGIAEAQAALTSLSLGLLMGLERERRESAPAGLRTFALVALAGSVCAMLTVQASLTWLIPSVAVALVATMIASGNAPTRSDATSTVALLLCFLFGALATFGHVRLTVALTLATTALLYFKTELHDATARLTRQDIVSILQFALITFVVLPLLPDESYGPYGQLNPFRIWLMVVLTTAISLAGYAVLRVARDGQMIPLLGVLGGMVSSTVTTFVFARAIRVDAEQMRAAAAVILIANLTLLVRIGVLAAVIAPAVLPTLAPVLGLGLIAGLVVPLRESRALGRSGLRLSAPEFQNPVGLGQAIAFGAIYALVLVLSAALNENAGTQGVYALSALSGTADMDALTLSSLQLFKTDSLSAGELTRAIVIAVAANLCTKAGIVLVVAGRRAAAWVALNYLPVCAGFAAALAIAG